MLQSDLDILRHLANMLTGHAELVERIGVSTTVTMPGSPIAEVSTQVCDEVTRAYHMIGEDIRGMAQVTASSSADYETTDKELADHLRRYLTGEGTP